MDVHFEDLYILAGQECRGKGNDGRICGPQDFLHASDLSAKVSLVERSADGPG